MASFGDGINKGTSSIGVAIGCLLAVLLMFSCAGGVFFGLWILGFV